MRHNSILMIRLKLLVSFQKQQDQLKHSLEFFIIKRRRNIHFLTHGS
jgi:hypothetical protein